VVGIFQIDGKIPNLALLQIAAFYLSEGVYVEPYNSEKVEDYRYVFASQIFNFSKTPELPVNSLIGGTGFDVGLKLPEEYERAKITKEAWELYPNYEPNLGFTMRGCRMACDFCVVPKKEGRPVGFNSLSEILVKETDKLVLLDNDFFGGPYWEDVCREIIDRKLKVSFAQGLNLRLINERQASYLAKIKFKNQGFTCNQVTFAWDRYKDKKVVEHKIELLFAAGIKPYRIQFFILIGFDSSHEEDLERILTIRRWKCDAYVMRMMEPHHYKSEYDLQLAKHLQRWVNRRLIKVVSFEEYLKGRKFEYLENIKCL
jgi:radical SAM superfamily enzyme YgiQ (UPF0313 family)